MSSSSSSSENGNGNGNGDGSGGARRGGDYEGPSSSRLRGVNEVWPEPFLESLAAQLAIDASRSTGRLAAAPALANLFLVCSTWRAVSRSDLLWHRLTLRIWGHPHLAQDTWHEEFIYWHRTTRNFHVGRSSHVTLQFDRSDVDDPDGLTCHRLTLSDRHLACGFADSTVRVFHLATRLHVSTFRPQHRDRLGRFSQAVSGIVINDSNSSLIFATLDGDIHVAVIGGPAQPRRAHAGDVVNDGALVDFTGCGRYWVGLYAGVPGRAFHIWNGNTEELVFVGGSLTDPEAVMGWHMLTDLTELVGRVRVTGQNSAVACTSLKTIVFDLRNEGVVLDEEDNGSGLIVTSVDASNEAYVMVDSGGIASVRRADTLHEVCSFNVMDDDDDVNNGAPRRGVMGCMNRGYALMCAGGVIRVWEAQHGEYLYRFREGVGDVKALVADERHVAACSSDMTIHVWDFGAQ